MYSVTCAHLPQATPATTRLPANVLDDALRLRQGYARFIMKYPHRFDSRATSAYDVGDTTAHLRREGVRNNSG